MLKIQTKARGGDWTLTTRAGELPNAWHVLHAYRIDYPSEEHRLVEHKADGSITVIPDDADELLAAEEIREIDAEIEKFDPLDHIGTAKLEDIIGKTIVDAQQLENGLEITFSDKSFCMIVQTSDKELLFTTGESS